MQPPKSSDTTVPSNDSVFSLRVDTTRLQIASNDAVTAVAATGGLLWVGTESGRLIRHDTINGAIEEVRGRLGVGRLDNAVWRIYADPHTHAALIILRNADGYLAHGMGLVRPRWLAKLRGLRCVSATWLRVPQLSGERSVVLLGTAFGALFSLTVDGRSEKDDALTLLWNAPHGERIDGIRVEQVAGKFVATLATTNALYLFSDALSLADLFVEERTSAVKRSDCSGASASLSLAEEDVLLPSELQFMTGNSGVASRRFVWAAAAGVTYAQLAVRRRRTERPSQAEGTPSIRPTRSTVIASVTDKDTISWAKLKDTTGSAVPLACNLTAFHVLILYPGSVYAFNHISGKLTQRITLWNRGVDESAFPISGSASRSGRVVASGSEPSLNVRGAKEGDEPVAKFLSSPAAGFARDVLVDCLWVYTGDGEFARLAVTSEEQTEAWKAAKAMRRFDLAMALAPLVSDGVPDNSAMFQTREVVLEAQADHAASEGDWDIAAQLYAKTNRPVESVILSIVDACWKPTKSGALLGERADLRALGIGARLKTIKHVITYLVRKLDRMDTSKPMQRTIIATMLVQLYSSQLASESDATEREEVRKDFGNFLADRHGDLEIGTALGILAKNGCHEEAWDLAVLSGNVLIACEMSSRRGQIEQSLSLLKNSNVLNDGDVLSQLVSQLSNNLIPQSPKRVATALSKGFRKDAHYSDHVAIVQGFARVARQTKDKEKAREAYAAGTGYLFDLLHDWKGAGRRRSRNGDIDDVRDGDAAAIWLKLVTFLFVLHAEFGTEGEAQRSYDVLIAPHVASGMSGKVGDALGVILRCAIVANFQRLCVFLYQALGLHETAVLLAVGIDIALAEAHVAQLGSVDVSDSVRRQLWCLVARGSDDPVGVVERSKGILHIEDVLNDMEAFESATERVKTAVANSLEEHKRLANLAKSEAASALEVTSCLREDVVKAKEWQHEQHVQQHGLRYRTFSCGHRIKGKERLNDDAKECALCGPEAIASVDAPFDSGLALPVKVDKPKPASSPTDQSIRHS